MKKVKAWFVSHAKILAASVSGFVASLAAIVPAMASEASGTVTYNDFKPVVDSLTSQISVSTVVSVLAIAVGAAIGFVFMWWGIRKVYKVIMSAFRVGRSVWVSPAIRAVLQMMEPNALPAAIAAEPSNTAVVDTRISGSVVPRLTIVAPTTISGIPIFFAIATAASTRRSPPRQIRTSPTTNSATVNNILSSSLDSRACGPARRIPPRRRKKARLPAHILR